VIDFAAQFLRELIQVFLEASPYILFGFAVAACLQVLLPIRIIQKLFGGGRIRSILAASILGIPLPLCSCSVLPTAIALRKRGASRGATVSFLVATPETGVDSIALTYGLMDPLMAVFRPLAAFVSAVAAGVGVEIWGGREPGTGTDAQAEPVDAPACERCEPEDAVTPATAEPTAAAGHTHDALAAEEARQASQAGLGWWTRLRRGFVGAWIELFDETSHWMFAGLVISALISVLLPAEVVTKYLSSGAVPMVLMLVLGIPLYICASASTPIAAALVLKGLSPGAALVFLLAGPATNIGSLAILSRFLGRRVMVIYLVTIAVFSLGLGFLLDALYPAFGITPGAIATQAKHLPMWFGMASAVVFAALLFFSFRRAEVPSEFRAVGRFIERTLGLRFGPRTWRTLASFAALAWVVSQCCFLVPPGSRGLVRRFGEPVGGPRTEGLHAKFPPPIEVVRIVRTDMVRRIEIGFRSPGTGSADETGAVASLATLEDESMYLTGDENLLDTKSVVQYRVRDAERYYYGFADADNTLKLEAVAEMLDVVAGLGIDGIYTTDRSLVEARVMEGLSKRVETADLGIEVLMFNIRDVHAPPEVHAAFRDVASAQEDKQTAINVAYKYLDETVNLARGEATRQLELARGQSVGQVLRAEGDSRSLKIRAEAYRLHRVGTYTRLYLETVESVLTNATKVIRPGWGASGNIDLWLSSGGQPIPVKDVLRGSQAGANDRTKAGE
jgi:hypothetical protein